MTPTSPFEARRGSIWGILKVWRGLLAGMPDMYADTARVVSEPVRGCSDAEA